jgi:hypothetical protein
MTRRESHSDSVIRRLATEAMADYACANPPYRLKMCPTMTLEIPPAVATEVFTDAKAAVDRLEEFTSATQNSSAIALKPMPMAGR